MGLNGSKTSFIPPASLLINNLHLKAARYCKNVYSDEFMKTCDHFIENIKTDTQCVIDNSDGKLFICFRGSDHIIDWKSNFNLDMKKTWSYKKDNNNKFHDGFLNAWCSVKEEITTKIKKSIEKDDINEIIFTGHSAGTVCNLAAYDLYKLINGMDIPMQVITFGSPRCCNKDFEEEFESIIKCTRFVLDRDIITLFPLSLFGDEYRHIGSPIQMRENEVLTEEIGLCESIKYTILGLTVAEIGVLDHDIKNYIKEIEKYI